MIWQLFGKSKNVKLEEQYMQLLKEESVYEKAIARDLPRASFINHEYFQLQDGQEALFNVVKAYSLYDTEVGYSQSLLHITGPLLLNVSLRLLLFICILKKQIFRCLKKKLFVYLCN